MTGKDKKILPKIKEAPIKKTKIIVIGIGGGGSSIVSEIASRGIKHIDFLAVNTDTQALKMINDKVKSFLIGQNLTFGLGTGMNPELGEKAALEEKEKIKKILKDYDLCLIVSSLGGGVSSGASPVFAKIARNLNLTSLGIFTLPFQFEGEKKMEIAKSALAKLSLDLNALSFIPNQRIFQVIEKTTPLKTALSVINKNLSENLSSLIETIYQPSLINIDFADLKTILEKRGRLAYLNTIEAEKKNDLKETIKKLVSNPLYPYSINDTRGILFNIVGEKNLNIQEMTEISKSIFQLVNKEAKIIFGISVNKKYKNKIKITLLATGPSLKDIPLFKPSNASAGKKIKESSQVKTKTLPTSTKIDTQNKQKLRQGERKMSKSQVKKESKKSKIQAKKPVTPPIDSPKEKKEVVLAQPKQKSSEELTTKTLPIKIIRKNALQIKKEVEEAEKELLKQEEIWEKPAFLRLGSKSHLFNLPMIFKKKKS